MINDWALMSTSTATNGAVTLVAVAGWPTIGAIKALNNEFCYTIVDPTTSPIGAPLCSGIGYLSATLTLQRGTVEDIYTSGSNTVTRDQSPMTLPAGTKYVMLTAKSNYVAPAIPVVQSLFGYKGIAPNGLLLSSNTKSLTANVLYAACLEWPYGRPITAFACEIATLGGTGSDRLQLGMYTVKADGSPGQLVGRSGDILPNTTGFKSSSVNGGVICPPPGSYWFVMGASVGCAVRAHDAGAQTKAPIASAMGMVANSVNNRIAFCTTNAIGTGWTGLPSNITLTGSADVNSDFAPIIVGIPA